MILMVLCFRFKMYPNGLNNQFYTIFLKNTLYYPIFRLNLYYILYFSSYIVYIFLTYIPSLISTPRMVSLKQTYLTTTKTTEQYCKRDLYNFNFYLAWHAFHKYEGSYILKAYTPPPPPTTNFLTSFRHGKTLKLGIQH